MASQPFKPGNPTDPLPPTPGKPFTPGNPTDPLPVPPAPPQFPGNPTDPFPPQPAPAPTRPVDNPPAVPTRQQSLSTQADQQSAALTSSMQSILDELASTIGQSSAQSKATLQTVTAELRNQLKTASVQQAAQINQVLAQVANAATSGANTNQAVLDGIVNTLAAVPPSGFPTTTTPAPENCPPGTIPTLVPTAGSNPASYHWECLPPGGIGTGTGTQGGSASSGQPAPSPTLSPSPIAPAPQPVPPAPPKPKCNSCIITDDKGQWVESFNNLSFADSVALQNQVKMTPGYNITCFAMADQNCVPTLNPPFWSPPPKIIPVGGGGAPVAPVAPIVAPILVGGGGGGAPVAPVLSPIGGGGAPTLSPTGGGGGGAPTLTPGGGGGTGTLTPGGGGGGTGTLSPTGGGGGGTLTPGGGGGGTLTPSPTSQPPAQPQPPSTIADKLKGCTLPPLNMSAIPAYGDIGSAAWCSHIGELSTFLADIGKKFVAWAQKTTEDPNNPLLPFVPDLPVYLDIGAFGTAYDIFKNEWNGISCWIQIATSFLTGCTQAIIAALNSVGTGTNAITLYLVVIKGAITALKRFRVGTDAALWATVDINIEWPQLEAMLDYLINYSAQYEIPNVATAMRLYRTGWISEGMYNCWMRCNGSNPDVFKPVFDADRPRPAVQERQQLLWRQRPGNNNGGPQYTDAMFKSDLAVDGTHPAWNDLLYATRYQRYTIRELRQLMDAGVLNQQDAFHVFQDMGFDDGKATTLAQMEQVLTVRRREQEIVGYTPAKISQLYIRGVMKAPEVTSAMQSLFYTADQANTLMTVASKEAQSQQLLKFTQRAENDIIRETEESYKIGTINSDTAKNSLTSLGASADAAATLIAAWSTTANNETTKQVVSAVKKGWRSGYLPTAQVIELLQSAGLIPEKASYLLSIWQLEVQVDERVEDVSQILASVASGNMDPATAGARLANMGWATTDSDILVSEAIQRLTKAQAELEAKALAAAERAGKAELSAEKSAKAAAERAAAQSAKAAETLAKQALTAQKTARAALLKATPVSKLAKWLRDGMISQEAFIERMVLLGYPAESAALQAEEACHGKGASCVPTAGPDDATLQNLPT